MFRKLLLSSILVLPFATLAAAQQVESSIVALYRHRVDISAARVQQAKAHAEYENARYRRARQLYQQNAISREELEEILSKSISATQEIQVREAINREDKALLVIAIERDQAGLAMPICVVGNGGG